MIVRYAIKRLSILTIALGALVGSLQLSIVQKAIVRLITRPGIQITFSKISGFFPFKFNINSIAVRNADIRADIKSLKCILSAKRIGIKALEAEKVTIKAFSETKITPADFAILIPIINQRWIKNANIKELDITGIRLNNVMITYNRKESNSSLKFNSEYGRFDARWKFIGSKIHGYAQMGEYKVEGTFDANGNRLNIKSHGIGLAGAIEQQCFVGNIQYDNYKSDIKIWTQDEFVKIKLKEKQFGITGQIDYNLDKLNAKIYNVQIGRDISITPIFVDKSLHVSDFSARLGKGQIDFHGIDLSSDKFSLGTLSVKDVEVSQLGAIPNIKGEINGDGHYEKGAAKLSLRVNNFEYTGIELPKINISATYANGTIDVQASTKILNEKQKIDVIMNTSNWKIEGTAQGCINIRDYKIASGQRIRGTMKYQVKASGNFATPKIAGDVSISDGVYVNLTSGTYIRNMALYGKLQNETLDITKIYARDDSKIGGTVNGSGKIQYTNDKLKTDIKLKIDNFKAVDQKWLNARLFGNVSLIGDLLSEVKVKGDLYTEKPAIDVSGIVMLSMRSTDLITKKKPAVASSNPIQIKFPTDIKLSMKPELSVSGFGLQSSWDANAKVTGDLLEPTYAIEAKLKSGKIELTDNAFKLKDGDVLINNADTKIYVSAEKMIDKITVGAKFTQKEGQSKVDFYSNPYMSDKDVMSYILFDKNASEISMGEAMSLLGVMTKLSGGADFNILGRMKTIFGVDTISMKKGKTSSGEEYDAVSLGKKIGKFKVSVDQATGSNGTNVVAEADVAKNTKVSVALSSKDSFGGGILWSRRY